MEDFDLETFIPYRLAIAADNLSREFSENYRKTHNLSRADWRIIFHLSKLTEGEQMSVRDLEERAHLEKSKVSRSVSRLEDRAIVEKVQNDKDQRLVIIQLTPKGHKIFSQIAPQAKAFNEKLQAMLKDGGVVLIKELERLS